MTDGEVIAVVGVSLAVLYVTIGSDGGSLPIVPALGSAPSAQPPSRVVSTHTPRPDLVAAARDELGNPQGPCGAKAIVQLAARMIGEGAGLLDKPSGNNCDGRATDIIAYPDGAIFDVLVDAGGENGPTWQAKDPVDPGRWREA